MAGGNGTRLWPLSREDNPKQLQSFVGDKSLMTQTIEQIAPLIPAENVWIVTNQKYYEQIARHSVGVPKEQIITEPFALGTNLAVGLGLIHLAKKNPDEIVLVGWADAHIGKQAEFCEAARQAAEVARETPGVILGVKPNSPSTAYGYIEIGRRVAGGSGQFYEIAKFEEKPAASRAAEFCQSERYLWNSGISIWKASTLLNLMRDLTPDHFNALGEVSALLETENSSAKIKEIFADLPKTTIDQAIFEKAQNLVTLPVDVGWNDIGAWSAIYDVQIAQEQNVTRGKVISVDTEKCLIYAEKRLIATLGISDLVIVETEDAILIARKGETDRLKELYAKVKASGATCL